MSLSEQEIVRRENLQKIRDLGFDPFPAEQYEVNFTSTEITTEFYQANLAKKLEEIKGIGGKTARELRDAIFKSRGKVSALIREMKNW